MFFRVENLGPLREAEIDLSKELILLTGPNNTGKTYVAWSIYGLYRDGGETPEFFRVLADEILAAPKQEVGFERLKELWPSLLAATATRFASRLHLCFASDRQYFASVRIVLRAGSDEPRVGPNEQAITYMPAGPLLAGVSVGQQIAIQFFKRAAPLRPPVERVPLEQIPPDTREELTYGAKTWLRWRIMRACWPSCTILPTERTDVEMFAKELSTLRMELVNRAVEAELEAGADTDATSITRSVGRYPWPIQDSLGGANDAELYTRLNSEFADLATDLEVLIGGAVDMSKDGTIGFKPSGTSAPIGIHLTSSLVKSLVRLVFFFRHLAHKGDLLMIDEPELNLHPDNQRKVARVLAKAINRGLRIIMSTHSDYLVRELNNLILLNRDTKPIADLREKHGYVEAELLSPAKIGVYLFRDGAAEAVPVTEDGFEVATIEDEINRLNAVSQDIYAAIHE